MRLSACVRACVTACVCACVHMLISPPSLPPSLPLSLPPSLPPSHATSSVMVLDAGTIIEYDPPAELLSNRKSTFYSMAKDAGLVYT